MKIWIFRTKSRYLWWSSSAAKLCMHGTKTTYKHPYIQRMVMWSGVMRHGPVIIYWDWACSKGNYGSNIWGVYMLRIAWVKELLRKSTYSKQKRDSGWNWLYIHVIMTRWSGGVYILYECMLDTNKHCHWVNGWFCVPFDNMPQVISYNYDIERAVTSGWYSF